MLRLSGFAIPILVLAACDPPAPEATLKEIPAAFVGEWDGAGQCGGGGALAMSVTTKEIVTHDSRLDVTGVAPDGETAVRVDGHRQTSAASWDGSVRLELANGGRELNLVNGAPVVPRVKCS